MKTLKIIAIFTGAVLLIWIAFNVSAYFWEPTDGEILIKGCEDADRNACLNVGKVSYEPWTSNLIVRNENGMKIIPRTSIVYVVLKGKKYE